MGREHEQFSSKMQSDKATKQPPQEQWTSLLGATLETWIYHLLYVRRVYPSDSFAATRFLGVQCQVNRHPGVVDYVSDTLQAAVPALVTGTADEISLVIFKDDTMVLERYTISMIGRIDHSIETLPLLELEQAMRNLVLRIHSLEGRNMGSVQRCDSLCFKVTLRVPKATTDPSPDIIKALSEGDWFQPDMEESSSSSNERASVVRPLHRVSVPRLGLEMRLVAQC